MTKDITKFRKAIKESMKPLSTKQSEIELKQQLVNIFYSSSVNVPRYKDLSDPLKTKIDQAQQLIDTACVEARIDELKHVLELATPHNGEFALVPQPIIKHRLKQLKATNQEKSKE